MSRQLPDVICKACKSLFEPAQPSNIYCCWDCYSLGTARARYYGEHVWQFHKPEYPNQDKI